MTVSYRVRKVEECSSSEWNDQRYESRIEDLNKGSKQTKENKPYRRDQRPASVSFLERPERIFDKDNNKGVYRREAKRQREQSQHEPFDDA